MKHILKILNKDIDNRIKEEKRYNIIINGLREENQKLREEMKVLRDDLFEITHTLNQTKEKIK